MKTQIGFVAFFAAMIGVSAVRAAPIPGAPLDPQHPGSKAYSFHSEELKISCQGRAVEVFFPRDSKGLTPPLTPVIVFGHGQALDVSHYRGTFEHLAKKGIAAIHPAYDTGFFDQAWERMGRDYIRLTECVLDRYPELDKTKIIYSGHSKGAYVASIAAGLAFDKATRAAPAAAVLFAPAGADETTLTKIGPRVALTVVYSDNDTVVSGDLSRKIFERAGSQFKQQILLKSYTPPATDTKLEAGHFWLLTKSSFFGGGPEGALHYYGSWKWLVAAAQDLNNGGALTHPYLYGAQATEKGVVGISDELRRTW
jgi:hypothetical protein